MKQLFPFLSRQPITTGTSVLAVKFDGGVALAGDMLGKLIGLEVRW